MKSIQQTKTVFLPNTITRFGNQLCDVFRVFLYNKIDPSRNYVSTRRNNYQFSRYGMDDICVYDSKLPPHKNWSEFELVRLFPFERDEFVRKYFLPKYDYKNNITDRYLFQIRNGDYLRYKPAVIDRNSVFTKMVQVAKKLNPDIKTIDVLSDDIEYSKEKYDNILKSCGHSVNYLPTSPELYNDFERSWCYKHKLVMNSTFHYWGCYVSNVIYNYKNTIVSYKYNTMNRDLLMSSNVVIADYVN